VLGCWTAFFRTSWHSAGRAMAPKSSAASRQELQHVDDVHPVALADRHGEDVRKAAATDSGGARGVAA
jgi:hypothetical protein